jgi:hypothetical protein
MSLASRPTDRAVALPPLLLPPNCTSSAETAPGVESCEASAADAQTDRQRFGSAPTAPGLREPAADAQQTDRQLDRQTPGLREPAPGEGAAASAGAAPGADGRGSVYQDERPAAAPAAAQQPCDPLEPHLGGGVSVYGDPGAQALLVAKMQREVLPKLREHIAQLGNADDASAAELKHRLEVRPSICPSFLLSKKTQRPCVHGCMRGCRRKRPCRHVPPPSGTACVVSFTRRPIYRLSNCLSMSGTSAPSSRCVPQTTWLSSAAHHSIYPSPACLPVRLPVCPSVHASACPPASIHQRPSVRPPAHQLAYLAVQPAPLRISSCPGSFWCRFPCVISGLAFWVSLTSSSTRMGIRCMASKQRPKP